MQESIANQRGHLRMRRLRRALCVFNNGTSSLDVTLRDISPSGARVEGDGLPFLPQTFELRIVEGDGRHFTRPVRIVWTKGRTAGLEFTA